MVMLVENWATLDPFKQHVQSLVQFKLNLPRCRKGLAIKESTYHNLQYLENVLSHNLNKFNGALTKIVHFTIATDFDFICSFFKCQQKYAMHGFYLSNHAATRNVLPLCLYQQHSFYCHKLKETLHAGDRLLLSSKIIIPEIKMMSATLDQNCN